jgi:hypothetical protein
MKYNPIKAGQKINVTIPDGCEISITRPNGDVEIVSNPCGYHELNKVLFAKIKAATKAAGRGDVTSFVNKTKTAVYEVTAADAAEDSSAQIEKIMKAGE